MCRGRVGSTRAPCHSSGSELPRRPAAAVHSAKAHGHLHVVQGGIRLLVGCIGALHMREKPLLVEGQGGGASEWRGRGRLRM